MPRSVVALLALLFVLHVATLAQASGLRIAVLQPDSELLRAITIALAPWGVETTRSDVALPGSSQPEAVRAASRLAEQLQVQAVVWVTPAEHGSLLWVFDDRREVTTRELVESPPFDGAAAAAVALSIKTILRSSAVAPVEERRELPEATETTETAELERQQAASEFAAGVRWLSAAQLEPRLELAALVWLPRGGRLGLSVAASAGPGVDIDDSQYRGSYRELITGVKARVRLFELGRLSTLISIGGAAHFSELEGTLVQDEGGSASAVSRLNGSLDLRTSLAVRITRAMYLGTSLEASYQLAHQRYLVAGRPVFSPWPVTATLAGYWGVGLF